LQPALNAACADINSGSTHASAVAVPFILADIFADILAEARTDPVPN
jgi:hypothetical protein